MDDWKVPGAAIVIVKDGKVVLSKGYGLREVQKKLPITEQTLSHRLHHQVLHRRHAGHARQRGQTRLGQARPRIHA